MWEIYAFHNTESLAGIFNAVAAVMGASTYIQALAAVAFCGFVAAMVAYAFAPEKLQGWKWLGTVLFVYGVLFVPRVTVGIVDKTGGTPVRLIGNVPFGMAALGGLTSSIGNSITELFEAAFQTIPGPAALPAELAYQRNGLMFGSRLIQETRRTSIPNPALRTDLVNFVNNCTAFDLADGSLPSADFVKSPDLWATMANTNPARFSIVNSPQGITTATCDQVYASIDSRLPDQINELTDRLGLRLNPSLSGLAARAAVVNQIPQAYIRGQIAAASVTAAELVRQNALINAINDAGQMGCQRINDPSCMMLATGRAAAVASQNAAWINGAKIAEQALPVVRNVAEAMCYAVFPLVVLLLFLTSGRNTIVMLAGYSTALISIQLWPPLFAILNYMATIYSQMDQAAAAEVGGGIKALSLQTASPIYSNAVSAQAVVSYLVIGIPLLAYSLANRLVGFGTALMGGLSGLQSTVGNASASAAIGNSSMGNVTLDQRNVTPSTSNPWVAKGQDASGNWWTEDGTGRTAVSLLRNEGFTSHQVTSKVSRSDVEAASKTASAAASEALTASHARGATLSDALQMVQRRSVGSSSSTGQSLSSFTDVSQAAESLSAEARRVARESGYGEAQVAGTLLRFTAMPSAFGVGGGTMVEKRYGASVTEAEKKILDLTNTDTYRAVRSFGDRASRDQSFLQQLASEGQSGVSLSSSLSETTSRSDVAERRFGEAVAKLEETRVSFEKGETITRDLAQDPAFVGAVMAFEDAAARYGKNTQSLAAHFSSLLGNYSLHPIQFNDGSAVPESFRAVRDAHHSRTLDPDINPDMRAAQSANEAAVRHRPLSSPFVPSKPGGPAHMSDVAPKTDEIRSDVARTRDAASEANAGAHDSFDARHQLVRREDGGVVTHESLLGTTVRSLGRDVDAGIKDAVDALEREARKDGNAKKGAGSVP